MCACVWALTNVLCIFNFENSNSNPHKCFYIEMFRSPNCRVQSTLWKVKLFSVFFLLMNSKKNFFFTIKKIFFRIQHSFQFAYEPVLALHTYKGNNDVMYPVAETKSRYMFLCPDDYLWMMKEKVIVPPDHEEEGLLISFLRSWGSCTL